MCKDKIIYKNISHICLYLILSCIVISDRLQGQATLVNPSFEDTPSDATTPMGWFECNEYTTPDILPGFWGVYQHATDGETYVGLITRSNSTNEAIGQRLSQILQKGVCYQLKVELAYSKTFAGYNQPIKLRVWIGDKKCQKQQLIEETKNIDHTSWKKYIIQFAPEKNAEYIIFEAYYDEPPFSHRGNILIDGISAIQLCGKA